MISVNFKNLKNIKAHYYVEEIPQPKANVKPICKKDQKIVEQRIKKVKNKVQIKKTKHPNLNLNQLNGINNLTVAQSTILKIRNQVMNKNYMTNSLEIIQENFIAKKDQKILDKQNTKTTFLNSEEYRINNTFSTIPEFSVFIEKDITQINFRKLIEKTGRPPVLIIDPPWRIASPKSTGGLKIHYPTITDGMLKKLSVNLIQERGYVFLWYTNNKMKLAELLLVIWGYKHVRTLDWLKLTKNGIIFKCMGKPENRSNERCLVGIKGDVDFETDFNFAIEKVIQEQMREKSQKPDFLYRIVDQAFPDNIKMELFARKCNLRNFYISIGIEFLEKIFK